MAVCHDPLGAPFDLWEPKGLQGFAIDTATTGAPSWFEALTTDQPKATAFYTQLLGWTAESMALPHMTYTQFSLGGTGVAGMGSLPEALLAVGPHWGVYFTVPDADAALEAALKAGGALCLAPQDVPRTGRMAGILSPQGVRFYVIAYLSEVLAR